MATSRNSNRPPAGFGPDALWESLRGFPTAPTYCVAYSGGRDSHALLHAIAALRERLPAPVRAMHVNHGLLPQAKAWERHCAEVCAALGIPLRIERVDVRPRDGESLEAAARRARYAAFEAAMAPGELVLAAHHREDQAETVLFRMLRGGGSRALAGMAPYRRLGQGWLGRPLLAVSRAALAEYAATTGRAWIDDPSNDDPRFDRNFLRGRVLPVLRARWPGADARLAAAARQAAEDAELLDALAALDLREVAREDGLSVTTLVGLPEARRRNLLRYWLRRQGYEPPGRERLIAGLNGLLSAGPDRAPVLEWPGGRILRYRDRLTLDGAGELMVEPPRLWDLASPLRWAGGTLEAIPATGEGLRAAGVAAGVHVEPRRGGERIRPAGRSHTHSLKKLLQERAIPPRERARLPLIYVGERLAAVGDFWIAEGFQAGPGEASYRLRWTAASA